MKPARRSVALLAGLCLLAVLAGTAAALIDERRLEDERLQLLRLEAMKKAVEIRAKTLNGRLMGALTMLGLSHGAVQGEARGDAMPRKGKGKGKDTGTGKEGDSPLLAELQRLGLAFGANGCFVVGGDGVVKTSWDASGHSSSGLDVRFRPYFRTAMAGHENIYAAVSVSQAERVLYFAAPVHDPAGGPMLGALVARTELAPVDEQLQLGSGRPGLLVSPQGIVFAASQSDWIGRLVSAPTAERLAAIRAVRQFGPLFESRDPLPLPFAAQPGLQRIAGARHALATAEVDWNDPLGPWTLVLGEDLRATVPAARLVATGAGAAVLVLLLGGLSERLLRSRQRQREANEQLRRFAASQEATSAFRAGLSTLAARLQRCETLPELACAFLQQARELLDAPQGCVYVVPADAPEQLRLVAASAPAETLPAAIGLGEGLLGQCALDRRRLMLDAPPHGPWLVRSGVGQGLPAALLVAPLQQGDELVGLVELALLRREPETEQRLDDILALLTNSLDVLRHREHPAPETA